MSKAVKEQINDNTLYVEVEPQPYAGLKVGITYPPPISLGDTVYQARKWSELTFKDLVVWHPLETMPIELADKTFKVTGIEVEEFYPTQPIWFWKYTLEVIKEPIIIPPLTPYKEPNIPFGGLKRT